MLTFLTTTPYLDPVQSFTAFPIGKLPLVIRLPPTVVVKHLCDRYVAGSIFQICGRGGGLPNKSKQKNEDFSTQYMVKNWTKIIKIERTISKTLKFLPVVLVRRDFDA